MTVMLLNILLSYQRVKTQTLSMKAFSKNKNLDMQYEILEHASKKVYLLTLLLSPLGSCFTDLEQLR